MIQHSQDVSIRTQAGRRGRAALVRYISAATLARSADAGGAVGILLLAVDPGTGIRNGPLVGGLLAAAITLPHLLGSLLGKWLDRARDGRIVLAAGCVAYGAFLGVAAVLLGRAPLPLARSAVFAAGMCGPLLTGCLSSRLASMVDGDGGSQRRAEGWDAVTYGVAGTAGPAAVAALAAVTTPLTAMLTLAAGAVAAAVLILTLPRTEAGAGSEREALSVWAALRVMGACGPLRRVTVATVLTALSGGTLAVVAVVFGEALAGRSGAGAALVAAAGLGNLAGSLAVTAFPLRGEPERLTARWAAAIAVALGLCAAAPSYPLALAAFTLVGAAVVALAAAALTVLDRRVTTGPDPPSRAHGINQRRSWPCLQLPSRTCWQRGPQLLAKAGCLRINERVRNGRPTPVGSDGMSCDPQRSTREFFQWVMSRRQAGAADSRPGSRRRDDLRREGPGYVVPADHVRFARLRGRPNVLVVLLDDAGFGSSSAFGGPIDTPNFERLAAGGLRFTRFHTTALCSPTRQALLTGRNHHSVGMGGITEIATSAPGYSSGPPEEQGAAGGDPQAQRLLDRPVRQVP